MTLLISKSLKWVLGLVVGMGLAIVLWPDPVDPAHAVARWRAFFRGRQVIAAIPGSDIQVVVDSGQPTATEEVQESKTRAVVAALTGSHHACGDSEFPALFDGSGTSCYWECQFTDEGRVRIGDSEFSYKLFVDGGILLDSADVHLGLC